MIIPSVTVSGWRYFCNRFWLHIGKATENGCILKKQPFSVAFVGCICYTQVNMETERNFMEEYASLIIDIRKSRSYKMDVRNMIQKHILNCTRVLNHVLADQIAFKVDFSAGDELQGLFKNVVSAVMYARLMEILVNPVEIRAGIGIGEWNVRIPAGGSMRQDGPAYHMARKGIEEVYKRQTERFRIRSAGDVDQMGNYLINASMKLLQDQTCFQNEVQFMNEVMYPFVLTSKQEQGMNRYGAEMLKYLQEFHRSVKGQPKEAADESGDKIKLFSKQMAGLLKVQRTICIDGRSEDGEKMLESQKFTASVAAIAGKTRQNSEKLIKRGNVMIIRNMDYMALQQLYRQYGG